MAKLVLGWSGKKDLRFCYGASQSHNSNTLATSINTTIIKKYKKIEIDLSRIEYYNYHKKEYYANKYPNKESQN